MKRKTQQGIAAGDRLDADSLTHLRQCSRPVTFKDVEAIGKIGEASERSAAIFRFSVGSAKSISEARRTLAAENAGVQPARKDPVDATFKALSALWARAPLAARKRFCLEFAKELWDVQNRGASLANWAEAGDE